LLSEFQVHGASTNLFTKKTMPNIVPSPDFDNTEKNNISDFRVEGRHARISQEKVANLTTVHQSTVSRWVCTNSDITDLNPDTHYFWGYELKNFVAYLALDAKRISAEVRNHNIKLLSDASDVGFQALIDKMAGIVPETETNTLVSPTSEMLLADIKDIFTGIREDLRKSEEKANKYFQLSESHLKNMYNMYPSYFRMQDIQTGLSKFSTLEKLLKEVSEQLETTAIQRFYPLSHYLKEEGYTLRNGEKIAVSHLVSGWLKLSGKEMLKKSKEFHNATNQYPECSRPLILFAVEMVLSER
jgi:hypothetical protein